MEKVVVEIGIGMRAMRQVVWMEGEEADAENEVENTAPIALDGNL